MHILADHVTLSISYLEKVVGSPAGSLARAPKKKMLSYRIESPPPGKHPLTTSTPESRSFTFTSPPYGSIRFNLILLLKQLTLVAAGAVASSVSGLSVVTSKSTDAEKKDLFANGFWSPPTHTPTHTP